MPRSLRPAFAWVYAGVSVAAGIGYVAGLLPPITIPLLMAAAAPLIGWVGPRRNQPAQWWPWAAITVAGVWWAAAGAARDGLNPIGDFTSSRSLLPDVLALPGYLLVWAALYGLIRARDSRAYQGAFVDGALVALAGFVLTWEFLVRPTLDIPDVWLGAQISVAMYPVIDCVLLALACRLAFGGGRTSPSYFLLLTSMVLIAIGDVLYVFAELGEDHLLRVLDLPYALGAASFGAAALHPSMRYVHDDARSGKPLSRSRVLLVAGALMLPVAIFLYERPPHEGVQWVFAGSVIALGLLSVGRLLVAVSRQARTESSLAHKATHDDLTGLPNRPMVIATLQRALRDGRGQRRSAVVFLDLDQFKLVNDSMGHAVGDELLVAVGKRLAGLVRQVDLVGRIGGDEFVVVLDDVDVADALASSERIRASFEAPFLLSVGEVFTSASLGVATVESGASRTAADVLRDADTAMYDAKDSGRNAVALFTTKMRERIEHRVRVERDLRLALERGEVFAHFQPLVQLPNGEPDGFEALARWVDGDTMISPGEFIPIAEESGLIVQVGAVILDDACRHLARWRAEVPGLEDAYVAVNLSVRQVREADLVELVRSTLARHDLPGSALWLEITESVMMDDSRDNLGVLHALRSLGVRLSVDDFGTGYSSLSYLKRFPVSRVKIDRSFVAGLGSQRSDDSLVAAIVSLAGALGLATIAEGVETTQQAARLVQLGCHDAQGYLFARPLPPEAIPARVAELRSGAMALAVPGVAESGRPDAGRSEPGRRRHQGDTRWVRTEPTVVALRTTRSAG
jgi:diguanylate cyclase (GGDEF)-like protein